MRIRIHAVLVFLGFFAVPAFVAAGDIQRPSLALDNHDVPYVAWVEKTGDVYAAHVAKWSGHVWTLLGSALNRDPRQTAAYVRIELTRDEVPVVAWTEKPPVLNGVIHGSGKLYVARWNGNSWVSFGPSLNRSNDTVADIPILRLDLKGYPVVMWSEMTADFNADNVYLSRWDGARWLFVDRGALTIDVSTSGRARDLAIDSRNRPFLTWNWQIFTKDFNVFVGPWDGHGDWTRMGGSLNLDENRYAGAPTLALDSHDNPVVAFLQANNGFDVWVKRWDGKRWLTLGASLNAGSGRARSPRVVLGQDERPVVAWIDNQKNDRLFVSSWDGSRWVPDGRPLNNDLKANVHFFDMKTDGQGHPVVVWTEDSSSVGKAFVRRWNGSAWVSYGLSELP